MTAFDKPPSDQRRWSAATAFIVSALGAVVAAILLALVLMRILGGPEQLQRWLVMTAPYMLVWRLGLYAVFVPLYVRRWRPWVRAAQRRQADGGAAAHQRLIRAERLLVAAIVVIEATNLARIAAGSTEG